MLKILSLVALGIAIGTLATVMLRPSPHLTQGESATADPGNNSVPATTAMDGGRDPSYEALIQRVAELEAQLGALENELQASRATPPGAQETESPARDRARGLRYDQFVEQLVAADFTQERAEWIKSRYDEQAAELMTVSVPFAALLPGSSDSLAFDLNHKLRQELGDAEYERYRRATGQHTAVDVVGVAENSPAALAGLQPGDDIVSYGGNRVFDAREIAVLASQGNPGEAVIVDILRDSQPMQIVLQRAPLDAALFSGGTMVNAEHWLTDQQ